jgi:hypothetical protein
MQNRTSEMTGRNCGITAKICEMTGRNCEITDRQAEVKPVPQKTRRDVKGKEGAKQPEKFYTDIVANCHILSMSETMG